MCANYNLGTHYYVVSFDVLRLLIGKVLAKMFSMS